MKFALASLAATITYVSAHATFQQLWINGVDQGGVCVRTPTSNSPVTSVTGSTIACNVYNPASTTCSVAAGATVDVEMHQQPGDRTCATEAIGGNHDGPVIIYMAKVDSALTADPNSAQWFKVYENGLVSTDYWGTDVMNGNCGRVPFVVPSCLAPGDYLIRAEVIALHVAGSVGGAQFYISCYPIKVTGSGSTVPSSTVSFPGAYTATDPGIKFDLYAPYTSYTIPGPPVFKCSTTNPVSSTSTRVSTSSTSTRVSSTSTRVSSTSTRVSSSTSTRVSSTSTRVSSTSTRTSSSAAPTGSGSPLYGQCGGQGWTGPTFCSQGTCVFTNAYYSQCVP